MKFFLIFLCCFVVGLSNVEGQTSTAYTASIKHFDTLRIKDLTDKNGWLNLAGLYWLKPGDNTFGRAATNTLVFKHKNMPAALGKFKVLGNKISFEFEKGVSKFPNDYSEEIVLFDPANKTDTSIEFNQFMWSIIIREDKIGVRFRDLKSPALTTFKGNKRFAIHEKWNLQAKFLPPNPSGLFVTNVLGQTSAQDYAGKISFEYQGKNYLLDAISEGPGDLFVIFGDATNGINTYHTGRYMYVPRPDKNGNTFIDFNKAFNPPCAYTPYATCPIPPQQNILPFKVTAGELADQHK
jgi:uncharacterized protein (DUF1684 family)